MYNQFFGFSEKPFRLVPDPAYLFLSAHHEEALAHLKYAVSEGEGFVEITGEVGTGKTLLCRTFLEQLDGHTESAYIFNPRLSAQDLIKAVNDELGIITPDVEGIKDLIDALNAFLMEKKAEGKKVVLVIDEAQNLGRDVLEQVRLLSNLETTRNKLLQIVLVGQPELGELLDSHELRQLGQRITLSCRLRPLTLKETGQYIRHRLHVASRKTVNIFTRSAIRKIHHYSGGIPRLINIACDRALLCAYGFNQHKVSAAIAAAAIAELASRGEVYLRGTFSNGSGRRLGLLSLLAGLALVLLFQSDIRAILAGWAESRIPSHQAEITVPQVKVGPPASVTNFTTTHPETDGSLHPDGFGASDTLSDISHDAVSLADYLAATPAAGSRERALKTLLTLWGLDGAVPADIVGIADDASFFAAAAAVNGLVLHRIRTDVDMIRSLNLCAIMAFTVLPDQDSIHLAAVGAGDQIMILDNGIQDQRSRIPDEDIARHASGYAYVFWKNFYNYQGIIPITSLDGSIVTLKLHLRDLGHDHIDISPAYDAATRRAVEMVQAQHGIVVDGFVGPLTKIVLYNETPGLAMPRLREPWPVDKGPSDKDAASENLIMESGS